MTVDRSYAEAVEEAEDAEVEHRILATPPPEGADPKGETDPAPTASGEAFTFPEATLVTAPGSAGSASGGAKGSLKFEVGTEELGELMSSGQLGNTSFRATWGKHDFGEIAVASWSGRPDEDGAARSWLVFAVSQTLIPLLAPVYARNLFGKTQQLVLDPSQVSMEELLATKA